MEEPAADEPEPAAVPEVAVPPLPPPDPQAVDMASTSPAPQARAADRSRRLGPLFSEVESLRRPPSKITVRPPATAVRAVPSASFRGSDGAGASEYTTSIGAHPVPGEVWIPTEAHPVTYLATVLPGLEDVLSAEIVAKLPACRSEGWSRGKVLFSCEAVPDFAMLRTADNIYQPIGRFPVGPHKADLPALAGAVRTLPFPSALGEARTFFVNGSRTGHQTYSRFEAAGAASGGIAARFPALKPGKAEAHDLEFRLDVEGDQALLSLRLTAPAFRYRTPARAFSPAALRPTVAHGLVWLSGPAAQDRFLDPFCGSGTIIAERLIYPAAAVYGGDVSPAVLADARHNLHADGRVALRRWDARELPLDRHSIDRVVTNLPFGGQITVVEGVRELYLGCVQELHRVLAPRGAAILLTDQGDALCQAAEACGLRCEALRILSLKGRHPIVYRLTAGSGEAAPR